MNWERNDSRSRVTAAMRTALLLLIPMVALILPTQMGAQATTADVVGTVRDSSGSVVPGAQVIVANKDTGESRMVNSGSGGDFVVTALPPGTYSVTVTMSTFKKYQVPSITLAAGDKPRVDAALSVGDVSETISVEATTPLLQSETSTLQSSVNQQTVQDLPLNGRNFVQLVQLIPGANEGPPTALSNGTHFDDRRQSASISANGQSDVLNNNMVDGMDNNERLIGSLGVRPSVDAVSEIRVQTSVYSADTGRTAGAAINIVTKSGTNHLHGTLYEYFRNDKLNAYPFQFGAHNAKQELRQNQFGGSIGGPIRKDKTFFFGDFEAFRLVQQANPTTAFVPTAFEHNNPGNFSDQPLSATAYLDPATKAPYVIPAAALDNAARQYFALFPLPNGGNTTAVGSAPVQGIYIGVGKTTQSSNVYDIRGDHQINANNSLFARYSYNHVTTNLIGVFPLTTIGGRSINPVNGGFAPDNTMNALLSYVHIFSPNLLLTLQAGYLRVDNRNYPGQYGPNSRIGPAANTIFGQPNVNFSDLTSGLAQVSVNGGYQSLGGGAFAPLKDFSQAYQYQGTVNYTRGAQTFKVGGQIIRRLATSTQSLRTLPGWTFATLPQFLLGNYVASSRALSLVDPHYRWWESSFYVQDDYHASSKLTLNLGLRYDIFAAKTASNNQISNWDATNNVIVVAGTPGVSSTTNIKTSYGSLAPRLGFAYTAYAGLVVRGGFGMVFFPTDITSSPSLKNEPFLSAYGPFASTDTAVVGGPYAIYAPYARFQNGAPPATVTSPGNPVGGVRGVPTNYREAESYQYNLTIQKDFHGNVVTVAGVGVEGRRGPQQINDINAPPAGAYATSAAANAARPLYSKYPLLTTISWYPSEGISHYYGLQVSFDRRLSNGLSFGTNYTRSRLLDDYTSLGGGGGGYGYNYNKFGDRYEYGNSDLDIRNRGVLTVNYTLPFARNATGLVREVAHGWQVNTLSSWTAGQPFSITNATNRDGQAFGTAASDRPNLIGDPRLDASQRGVKTFFNTAAFAAQPLGTFGSAPRNPLYGPHFRRIDLSIIKSFPIRESTHLDFRAEGFNMTNSANFATPNASLGSPVFGQLTALSVPYSPRVLQLALKLVY